MSFERNEILWRTFKAGLLLFICASHNCTASVLVAGGLGLNGALGRNELGHQLCSTRKLRPIDWYETGASAEDRGSDHDWTRTVPVLWLWVVIWSSLHDLIANFLQEPVTTQPKAHRVEPQRMLIFLDSFTKFCEGLAEFFIVIGRAESLHEKLWVIESWTRPGLTMLNGGVGTHIP